uniref:Uncharacterized protein n=1 Tax=Anguilla anguilla TaxID=7936 RepID=A0A0E9T9M0_ANGAN
MSIFFSFFRTIPSFAEGKEKGGTSWGCCLTDPLVLVLFTGKIRFILITVIIPFLLALSTIH